MERKDCKNDKGAIILESLIVYPVTIFLLFFILAIFSVLYQRWNLQTIANESAARMAQTYRLSQADKSSGFVDETQLTVDMLGVDPEWCVSFRGIWKKLRGRRLTRG